MFANHFTRLHLVIFVVLWLLFATWTLCLVTFGVRDARPSTVTATVAGTVLGPMTGAISRDFQRCCLDFSISLMPYCLTALLVAILAQIIRLPDAVWTRMLRLAVWALGLVVWFGGGIISFGHALS